jgi:hypothetical protein
MHLRARVLGAISTVIASTFVLFAMQCGNVTDSASPPGSSPDAAAGGGGGDAGIAPTTDGAPVTSPDASTGPIQVSDSGLPALPELVNVTAVQREDSVGIDFDPVLGAVDYRVYPLPPADQITNNSDGSITIKNAIYRCAGMRQGWDLQNNFDADAGSLTYPTNGNPGALDLMNAPFNWTASVTANPTLGYVYTTSGSGLIPVYAVAGHPMQQELGFRESRAKIYTTDATKRQTLLGQGWRDDGIVFYVPSAASGQTQTVYGSENDQSWNCGAQCNSMRYSFFYFLDDEMSTHSKDSTPPAPAFEVLTSQATGTVPLMRVTYNAQNPHDELAVGQDRYQRALYQGAGPLWHVEWAGLTEPTTLVVEALKTGCPFQGFVSATHFEAPPHQTFYTLDDLQAKSPTGEVFLNGEYDDVPAAPVPIARSFIAVAPQPHNAADWDFYQGFNVGTDNLGTATSYDPTTGQPSSSATCSWVGCLQQDKIFQMAAFELDQPKDQQGVLTYGQMQGQLWAAFDDTGQDVTGRMRFNALQPATVAADAYLHVTMSVNIVSSDRRYPQLVITDEPLPNDCYNQQYCGGGNGIGTSDSNTIIVQTIGGPSMRFESEIFHGLVSGAPWNVNNQATEHPFLDSDPNNGLTDARFAALSTSGDPPFEHAGMDRMTRWDAFLSTQRMYVFFDGAPAGCTQYPSDFTMAPGNVNVSFGTVLYHEGAPDDVCGFPHSFAYASKHECTESSRHFDDLGFKAGVAPPTVGPAAINGSSFSWDEKSMPCAPY